MQKRQTKRSIYHEDIEELRTNQKEIFAGNEKSAGQTDSNYVRQVRRWRQQN